MTTTKTRPSEAAARQAPAPSAADALRAELADVEQSLEQLRRIQQAPRAAYQARQRAVAIRARLERLEREAAATAEDPAWPRKMAEATAEYDAALEAWQARQALRRRRSTEAAPADLGAPVAGMPSARNAGAVWLASEGPQDVIASARLSDARRRLRQLREWPDVLARQRDYERMQAAAPLRKKLGRTSGSDPRVLETIDTAELAGDVTRPPALGDPTAERASRRAAFAQRWNRRHEEATS